MLVALAGLWYLLAIACGIACLVFFIMVVMQMFKRDQSNLGIICIVLTFCTGIGPLIAFVYGWMKATEWNIKKTMTYWSVALGLYFIFLLLAIASFVGAAATMDPNDFDIDPNNMNFEFEMEDTEFGIPDDFSMPEDVTDPEESTTDQP